jgi:hypothetical protein
MLITALNAAHDGSSHVARRTCSCSSRRTHAALVHERVYQDGGHRHQADGHEPDSRARAQENRKVRVTGRNLRAEKSFNLDKKPGEDRAQRRR